jgi:phenylpropionate dioxygenase-like ring-hydroxylating dioxygenase large terminal subunit
MAVDVDLRALLEQGYTLPAHWYSDPGIHALERELIFSRYWQFVGPAEWLDQDGAYFAGRAGHIPVVVVRDGDEIRAFVNVCRHRAHIVAHDRGCKKTLQCPYHAWTYGLDGSLRNAPRASLEAGFDPAELGLLPVAVDTWGPLVFVNPDVAAAPLHESLGRLDAHVAASGVDLAALTLRRVEHSISDVNWKTALENTLECYHCQVAHPGFSRVIDVAKSAYELTADGLLLSQFGPAKTGDDPRRPPMPRGIIEQAQYHILFPSSSVDMVPGPPNLQAYAWAPMSPSKMASTTFCWFSAETTEEEIDQVIAFNDQVSAEDAALVDSVQEGLDSGVVPYGRLMPESEALIGRFQRLLYDALAGA